MTGEIKMKAMKTAEIEILNLDIENIDIQINLFFNKIKLMEIKKIEMNNKKLQLEKEILNLEVKPINYKLDIIEELKNKIGDNVFNILPNYKHHKFNFVLIELKQKLKYLMSDKIYYNDDITNKECPVYTGKMYNYYYVLSTNNKIDKNFYNDYSMKHLYNVSDILNNYNKYDVIKWAVNKTLENHKYKEDMINTIIKDDRRFINSLISDFYNLKPNETEGIGYGEYLIKLINRHKWEIKNKPLDVKTYKIKVEIGKMNYKINNRSYYNILNLKKWDKETKKTSNKDLKADTTYTWSDNYSSKGWVFGGIKSDDIENFSLINGFKKEKKKKYNYGDYAEWILHKLI